MLAHILSLGSGHLLNLSKNLLDIIENIWKVVYAFVQPGKVDHVFDVLSEVVLGYDISMFDLLCSPFSKTPEPSAQCFAQLAALWFKRLGSWGAVML